jgi:hypothetical protein
LVAPGFTQVDLHLGYRHRWFDVALDVENLLGGQFSLGTVRHRQSICKASRASVPTVRRQDFPVARVGA